MQNSILGFCGICRNSRGRSAWNLLTIIFERGRPLAAKVGSQKWNIMHWAGREMLLDELRKESARLALEIKRDREIIVSAIIRKQAIENTIRAHPETR